MTTTAVDSQQNKFGVRHAPGGSRAYWFSLHRSNVSQTLQMLLKHVNTWSEFWHQQIVTNLDLQSQVSTTRGRKAFTRHGFHCIGVMFLRHFKFHRTLQISGPALVQHLANKISICCIRSVGSGGCLPLASYTPHPLPQPPEPRYARLGGLG